MNLSNWMADTMLNQAFRGVDYTWPDTVYLALYTTDPTKADTGTEVSGNGYARQEIPFSAPELDAGQRTIMNDEEIQFPVATGGNWGAITHVGIRTAATGGQLMMSGPLQSPRTINAGERFIVLVENGKLRLD